MNDKVSKGQYRDGNYANVTDGTIAMDIPREIYEEQGYEPSFELLPTKAEYQKKRANDE